MLFKKINSLLNIFRLYFTIQLAIFNMRKILKKHSEFLKDTGFNNIKTEFFILKTRPCIFKKDPRYGIITTKKVFKLAIERNRAKRRLKASLIILNEKLSDELDYIFILKKSILNIKFKDLLKIIEESTIKK